AEQEVERAVAGLGVDQERRAPLLGGAEREERGDGRRAHASLPSRDDERDTARSGRAAASGEEAPERMRLAAHPAPPAAPASSTPPQSEERSRCAAGCRSVGTS